MNELACPYILGCVAYRISVFYYIGAAGDIADSVFVSVLEVNVNVVNSVYTYASTSSVR